MVKELVQPIIGHQKVSYKMPISNINLRITYLVGKRDVENNSGIK